MPSITPESMNALRNVRSTVIDVHSRATTLRNTMAPDQRQDAARLVELIERIYGDLSTILIQLQRSERRRSTPSVRIARTFLTEVLDEPGMSDKEKLIALAEAIFEAREPEPANDNTVLPDFKNTVVGIIRELRRNA